MRLTIFETGRPPEPIVRDFPGYPVMLEKLLKPHLPKLECETISIISGEALPLHQDVEAVLITGSPVGVYDEVEWILPLKAWVKEAGDLGIPQVGICFGHQLMAEAFGGHAQKAPQGWGLGRHSYDLVANEPWIKHSKARLHMAVSHQDQVLKAPPTARILARSDFTPFAALVYDHAPALSFQGHPEFCKAFATSLISSRRGTRFSEEMADTALASLDAPLDGDVVASWIGQFYTFHAANKGQRSQAAA
jgi:GMP synthase-like glutamine amidotransferase